MARNSAAVGYLSGPAFNRWAPSLVRPQRQTLAESRGNRAGPGRGAARLIRSERFGLARIWLRTFSVPESLCLSNWLVAGRESFVTKDPREFCHRKPGGAEKIGRAFGQMGNEFRGNSRRSSGTKLKPHRRFRGESENGCRKYREWSRIHAASSCEGAEGGCSAGLGQISARRGNSRGERSKLTRGANGRSPFDHGDGHHCGRALRGSGRERSG